MIMMNGMPAAPKCTYDKVAQLSPVFMIIARPVLFAKAYGRA
jgi:hypothetical protein